MIDYNDGKWHGWNGGECPVHPESIVDVLHAVNGILNYPLKAGSTAWASSDLAAFRVIKPYREPREFYVREITCFYLDGNVTGKIYQQCTSKDKPAFLVREVIE
jgi:hypothetical protein